MAQNKHISKIIAGVMAVAVLLCFLAIGYSDKLNERFGGTGVTMEYESKLFDTSEIISIDIKMDEEQWNTMLQNASSEEYCVCDVVINGLRVNNVAIRPKGNTSLSAIAMDPDSDRFSLKLEFDHFVDGQTCYGLDKLILNNNYADATNMKEAIIYDMYQYIGAEASLYNYAKVSLNGEYWGVYLALEGVEQSFMLRNFGTQDGELYKPDSMEMGGGGDFGNFKIGGAKKPKSRSNSKSDSTTSDSSNSDSSSSDSGSRPSMPGGDNGSSTEGGSSSRPSGDSSNAGGGGFSFGGGGGGGFSMGNGGSNLNYTDDDLDSYSTIWDGEITETGQKDHRRVVTALKNISEGTDIEKYMDVDNILKYMAVHTFAVNMDSLSGSMAHNYYLYEYDGRLNIFPWDYNLSFGGMSMGSSGNATEMVNDAIDTPFSGTKFFDALLENEEYLAKYHSYLQQLVDEYVNGGRFDEVYNRIRSQIDSLVETDPTAFFSYDEYNTAAEVLYETIKLRAESIDGQLKGTIPSTDAGQREDSSALIDASHIDVKAMGQFSMGMGGGSSSSSSSGSDSSGSSGGFSFGGFGGFGGSSDKTEDATDSATESTNENTQAAPENAGTEAAPDSTQAMPGNMPEGFDPSNMQGFDPSSMPEGFDPSSMGGNFDPSNMPEGFDPSSIMGGTSSDSGASMPASFPGMPGQSYGQQKIKNLVTYGACLAVMVIALIAVKIYKRRK